MAAVSPRVVVLIPWRTDGGVREQIHRLVREQADSLGVPVVEADSRGPVFSIAQAWNRAARAAGPWDVAIQWGADLLLDDPTTALAAAAECTPTRPFVFAFDQAVTLTRAETETLLGRGTVPGRTDALPYSGPRATHRTAWDRVGWYDERFVGWGPEDRAFWHAIRLHYGPAQPRIPGRVVIPWHPRKASGDPYWTRRHANRALYAQVRGITDPATWARHVTARDNPE